MRCRKNVKSLDGTEKANFAKAIVLLKNEPSLLGNPNRYDDYVLIHRQAMDSAVINNGNLIDPGWAHFDSAFLPWHRELIFQFEEELRALVPGVTVPYWDWTRAQQSIDDGWPFTHDFIGVEGTQSINFQNGTNNQVLREPANAAANPYPYEFDPEAWSISVRDTSDTRPWAGLTRNFADEYNSLGDANVLPQNDTVAPGANASYRGAINVATYLELRDQSESIHNLVHRWVGGIVPIDLNNNNSIEQDEVFVGDMLSGSSPNDPVFWLHHAAIDRMWSIWREKNPGHADEFYFQNITGVQGHGIDDDLIFHEPAATDPFNGPNVTPRQLINGHTQHGISVWYESDLPEIINETGGTLNFANVPSGLTQYKAVRFRVQTCRPLSFRISGAPMGDFGAPNGLNVTVMPDLDADSMDVYVWVSYTANGGSPSGQVVIEAYLNDEEGYYTVNEGDELVLDTYTVSLEATTQNLESNAVALVLDRSGSMSAAAGGGSSRIELLKDAVDVFHKLMQAGDEIGIISFDDLVEIPLPLTTQSAGLGTTLTGNALDPRGRTGIGQAILQATNMLNGATHANRSMLVLTDGNENEDPRVADLPAGTIHDKVYAIGFGLQGEVSDEVLNQITQNNSGDLVITGELSDIDEEYLLTKHFIQILAEVTSASVVLDPRGELTFNQKHTIPFQLTSADVSVDVILLSTVAPFLDFRLLTPTGKEITPQIISAEPNLEFVSEIKVSFYRMLLPAIPSDSGGSHGGTWKVILSLKEPKEIEKLAKKEGFPKDLLRELERRKAISYSCIVHARSNLQLSASVHQKTMLPGEKIRLRASLTEYFVPHAGSARVWCEIIPPKGSPTDLKLKLVKPGDYAASFVARNAGIYKIRFRASGATRDGHSFTREKTLSASTFVRRDKGDPGGSDKGADYLCELFARLFSEHAANPQLREELKATGVNIEALQKYAERYCKNERREFPDIIRRKTPEIVGTPISSGDITTDFIRHIFRKAGVSSLVNLTDDTQRKQTVEERKAIEALNWFKMRPSNSEISKSVNEYKKKTKKKVKKKKTTKKAAVKKKVIKKSEVKKKLVKKKAVKKKAVKKKLVKKKATRKKTTRR